MEWIVIQPSTATGESPGEGAFWVQKEEIASVGPRFIDDGGPVIDGIRVTLNNDESYVVSLEHEEALLTALQYQGVVHRLKRSSERGQ